MITFKKGNLLDSPCEALINTVNVVGVMGKGLAKEFKAAYPEMFRKYRAFCDLGIFKPGECWTYETGEIQPRFIICFAIKNHWKQPSELQWIRSGLKNLNDQVVEHDIMSIAIPALGCGNGGLEWPVVKEEILNAHLTYWKSMQVLVYEPS